MMKRSSRVNARLLIVLLSYVLTFSISGNASERVLHAFASGTDGVHSYAGLVLDQAGNLYGTTSVGGTYNLGTIFELSPSSNGGWAETILHSFAGSADGANPYASLVLDGQGNLY